jgi:hypothetical protein
VAIASQFSKEQWKNKKRRDKTAGKETQHRDQRRQLQVSQA